VASRVRNGLKGVGQHFSALKEDTPDNSFEDRFISNVRSCGSEPKPHNG
jgi:hypothetical protein